MDVIEEKSASENDEMIELTKKDPRLYLRGTNLFDRTCEEYDAAFENNEDKVAYVAKSGNELALLGVYFPVLQNIFGAILFIKTPFIICKL